MEVHRINIPVWIELTEFWAKLCGDLKSNNKYSGCKRQDILDQPKNYQRCVKDPLTGVCLDFIVLQREDA
jgi:hypothetical protein